MVISLLICRCLFESLTKRSVEFNLRALVNGATHCYDFANLYWWPFHHSFVMLVTSVSSSRLLFQDRVLSIVIIAVVFIYLTVLVFCQCGYQDTSTCCRIHQLVCTTSLLFVYNLIWHSYLLNDIYLLRCNHDNLGSSLIRLLPLFLRKSVVERLSSLKRLILVRQLVRHWEGARAPFLIKLIFTEQTLWALSNIAWSLYYLNATSSNVGDILSAFMGIVEREMFNVCVIAGRIWRWWYVLCID